MDVHSWGKGFISVPEFFIAGSEDWIFGDFKCVCVCVCLSQDK